MRLPGAGGGSPLFRNAYALMLNTGISGVLGLGFWLAAARYYSESAVGQGSAAIAAMKLLAGITAVTLTGALARFIPVAGRATGKLIFRTYAGSSVIVGLAALVFLFTLDLWGASYRFLHGPLAGIGFVAAVVAWSLLTLQDGVLTGLRNALWVPVGNTVFSVVKLGLLIAFAAAIPTAGVFVSWVAAIALSVVPLGYLVFRRLVPRHVRDTEGKAQPPSWREIGRFLAGDYTGSLFSLAVVYLVPVIVASQVSSEDNAYFYIATTIAGTTNLLAINMGASLTVEGAHDPARLAANTRAALRRMLRIMLPVCAVLFLGAPYILHVFGAGYAEAATPLLRWFAVGSALRVVMETYFAVLRAQSRTSGLAWLQGLLCALVLGLTLVLLPRMGLTGAGVAEISALAVIVAVAAPKLYAVTHRTPAERTAPDGDLADLGTPDVAPRTAAASGAARAEAAGHRHGPGWALRESPDSDTLQLAIHTADLDHQERRPDMRPGPATPVYGTRIVRTGRTGKAGRAAGPGQGDGMEGHRPTWAAGRPPAAPSHGTPATPSHGTPATGRASGPEAVRSGGPGDTFSGAPGGTFSGAPGDTFSGGPGDTLSGGPEAVRPDTAAPAAQPSTPPTGTAAPPPPTPPTGTPTVTSSLPADSPAAASPPPAATTPPGASAVPGASAAPDPLAASATPDSLAASASPDAAAASASPDASASPAASTPPTATAATAATASPAPPAPPAPAAPRPSRGPVSGPARRGPWVPRVLGVLLVLALGLYWGPALRLGEGDLDAMGGLGLVSVLPLPTLAGAALLVGVFAALLWLERPRTALLAVTLVATVVSLHALPAVIETEPRFATAWQHLGFLDYIDRTGTAAPDLDARWSWPGFFAAAAFVAEACGVSDLTEVIRWWPTAIQLLYLAPMVLLTRHMRASWRAKWAGLWIFVLSGWVGQDYFSPQGFTFLLYLVFVAILLVWFRAPRVLWSRRRPGEAEVAPADRRQQAVLLVILLGLFAATVPAHQLTPFVMLGVVTVLVLVGRCELRGLPLLFGVLVLLWLGFLAEPYWSGHFDELFGGVGGVGGNVSSSVSGRIEGGDPSHKLVLYARVALAGSVLALACWGWLRRRRHRYREVSLVVLTFVPFLGFGMQSYGGEMALRVFMFALPGAALLGGLALFPRTGATAEERDRDRRAGLAPLAALLAGLVLVGGFLVARWGNEPFERVRTGEVAAMEYVYAHDDPTVRLLWMSDDPVNNVTPSIPWGERDPEKVEYLPTLAPADPARVSGLVEALEDAGPNSYLMVNRGQSVYLRMDSGYPANWDTRLLRHLDRRADLKRVLSNADATLYALRDRPDGPVAKADPGAVGPKVTWTPWSVVGGFAVVALLLLLAVREVVRVAVAPGVAQQRWLQSSFWFSLPLLAVFLASLVQRFVTMA
ncbi:lipopolysaccharide biosynthesis protein [Streptomyces sp. CC224B]|uniref:lipopolysaccharide biosynthesis protein n=1 Tax=Streptomyces sp. CC224B TaxID=3044571 RepID=UPI0024A90FB7|nr:lipopolysaccharide biosynthesis protein [Streptomyces sp. CC224B]